MRPDSAEPGGGAGVLTLADGDGDGLFDGDADVDAGVLTDELVHAARSTAATARAEPATVGRTPGRRVKGEVTG